MVTELVKTLEKRVIAYAKRAVGKSSRLGVYEVEIPKVLLEYKESDKKNV